MVWCQAPWVLGSLRAGVDGGLAVLAAATPQPGPFFRPASRTPVPPGAPLYTSPGHNHARFGRYAVTGLV